MRCGSLLGTALISLGMGGCGGGGGGGLGGGGGTAPDAAVGGMWSGTTVIAGQGAVELIGITAEDGRGYILQEDGVLYWGTVSSSGNQFTATLTGAGLFGLPFWDGSTSGTGTVSGTIRERSSISATSSFTTSLGATTTSTISLAFEPLYNDDSSLALIAGNYVDALGLYGGVLNVAGDGALFLQDPDSGCVINGHIAIINAEYNAYDVQFSYSACTGPNSAFNGVTFRGLVVYDALDQSVVAFVDGMVGGMPYPNVFIFSRV